MKPTERYAWELLNAPLRFNEVGAPAAAQIGDNTLALYAKDRVGVSGLYYMDDAGVEHDLGAIGAGAEALTRVNDTNVTLTLGGSPTIALLKATSLTLGWTGTLSAARGGTGVGSLGNVTAGSSKISLGGTPTGASILSFSIDVVEANLTHNSLGGLTTGDPHTQYLLVAGTRALTGDWDAGSFEIRAQTFESDVATGTAPLVIASTTKVANLNADLLDDQSGAYYLDSANFTGTDWDDLTDGGETSLHSHSGSGSSGSSGGGHLHGITRLTADGSTTVFNLLDIAEYIELAFDNGSLMDPLNYTLSADGSQIAYAVAPTAAHFIEVNYVIAGL